MRFAYADPPYLGLGHYYAADHPDARACNDPEWHRALIDRLATDYPDGWALSCTTNNLRTLLPMTPADCRVGAWVKPYANFKPGVSPAYCWEPVIFRGGRKRTRDEHTVRDWVSENITMQRGFVGAKPRRFALWVFDLLNVLPGDEVDDLFPGSGAVQAAIDERLRAPVADLEFDLG
jgi:hypothetical protein